MGWPSSTTTASKWIEPLRSEYANTAIDPRVREDTNPIEGDVSKSIEDVSTNKLETIRSVASGDTAEELVRRVVEYQPVGNDRTNVGFRKDGSAWLRRRLLTRLFMTCSRGGCGFSTPRLQV
jgi:hypothetical protein